LTWGNDQELGGPVDATSEAIHADDNVETDLATTTIPALHIAEDRSIVRIRATLRQLAVVAATLLRMRLYIDGNPKLFTFAAPAAGDAIMIDAELQQDGVGSTNLVVKVWKWDQSAGTATTELFIEDGINFDETSAQTLRITGEMTNGAPGDGMKLFNHSLDVYSRKV
jgi:hypothetical protein